MDLTNYSLSIEEFAGLYRDGIPVIDTRPAEELTNGYILHSLTIPAGDNLQSWMEKLIGRNQPFLLVDDDANIEATLEHLDPSTKAQLKGYLRVGVEGWLMAEQPMDILISIDTEELILDFKHDADIQLIDVRSEEAYKKGHLKNARNIPVNTLIGQDQNFTAEDKLYVYSQQGQESVIAASFLKRQGLYYTRNIAPGFSNLQETEIPVVK